MAHKTPEYKALQKSMHAICSSLSGSPDSLIPLATDLCGEEVINESTAAAVRTVLGVTPYNRASKLVTAVLSTVKFNTGKFRTLVDKLDEHGFPEVADKLRKQCVSQGGAVYNVQMSVEEVADKQLTAAVQPQQTSPQVSQLPPLPLAQGAGYSAPVIESANDSIKTEQIFFDHSFNFKQTVAKYNISNTSGHGVALIIHNHHWEVGYAPRIGSQHDVDAFLNIATTLNYSLVACENQTSIGMREVIANVAQMITKNHDSFMCFISSHGVNGGIVGVDGGIVSVTELAYFIGPSNCPSLINKPKIFFVQACRGLDIHNHVQFDSHNPSSEPAPVCGEDKNKAKFDSQVRSIPPTADYLFAYCTTLNTQAMRTEADGSFYVKVLGEILTMYGGVLDLHDMLLMVHNELATNDRYAYKCEGRECVYRQMGEMVSTLRKKIYFK